MSFAERYGPWALVLGASEGTGRAFAEALAARGLDLVLVARRAEPLDALAAELRAGAGVQCVTAAIDLAQDEAADRLAQAAGDREVGLLVANAGADPNGARFLDRPLDPWADLVRRNVLTTVAACHRFARAMRARGRGGILLANSGAAYGGGSFMACYTASKAFELNFAESLWAELKPHGVDVLTVVMGMTDTPAFRALLAEKGLPVPPGLADSHAVAAFALDRLGDGPVQNWATPEDEAGYAPQSAAARRARVLAVDAASAGVFGD